MNDLCVFSCTVHHVFHQQGYAIIERYLVLQATKYDCLPISISGVGRLPMARHSVTPETEIFTCLTEDLLKRFGRRAQRLHSQSAVRTERMVCIASGLDQW